MSSFQVIKLHGEHTFLNDGFDNALIWEISWAWGFRFRVQVEVASACNGYVGTPQTQGLHHQRFTFVPIVLAMMTSWLVLLAATLHGEGGQLYMLPQVAFSNSRFTLQVLLFPCGGSKRW